jgi:hypothetical protein
MSNKMLFSLAMLVMACLLSRAAVAAEECKDDKDCQNGTVCILALTPHQCKAPQAAGAACKRDAVCESKKCEIPAGKEVGACK